MFDVPPLEDPAVTAARHDVLRATVAAAEKAEEQDRKKKRRRNATPAYKTTRAKSVPHLAPAQERVETVPQPLAREVGGEETDSQPLVDARPSAIATDNSDAQARRKRYEARVASDTIVEVGRTASSTPACEGLPSTTPHSNPVVVTHTAEISGSPARFQNGNAGHTQGDVEVDGAVGLIQNNDADEEEDVEDEEEDDDCAEADLPAPTLAAQLDVAQWRDIERPAPAQVPDALPFMAQRRTAHEPRPPVHVQALRKRMKAIVRWEKILPYLTICGRSPFTADQYDILTRAIATAAGESAPNMQPYKTVRRQMRTSLVGWCFPTSTISFVVRIDRPRGVKTVKRVVTSDNVKRPAQACVRLVQPSEWAKLDVCTYPFYADVFEHPDRSSPDMLTIERTPIVQRRAPFVGRDPVVWSLFHGAPCITRHGDTITIPIASRPVRADQRRSVDKEWFCAEHSSTARHGGPECVRAVLCGSWVIGAVPTLGKKGTGRAPPPEGSEHWTSHEQALQCKLALPSPNQPAMDTVLQEHRNNGDARAGKATDIVRDRPDPATQTHLSYSTNVVQLHPGDHCVLLRAVEYDDAKKAQGHDYLEDVRTQHCLLIGSILRHGLGKSAERLVWIDIDESGDGRANIRYAGSTNVTSMPTWVKSRRGSQPLTGYDEESNRHMGFLPDGSRYVVYRFALYMDGFSQLKSARDTRSVGGYYLMPLGLSVESRRGTGAPHVITLASSSVSHNTVMKMVMDDISRAASEGVDGVDPYGRSVRIFLDPVTFFGDYPAAADCADVIGHRGNSFCTHCSVIKRSAAPGSSILCIPMNHSRRVGFARSDARLQAIRDSPLPKDLYRAIGMKSKDEKARASLPLVVLSKKLSCAGQPECNDLGEEVVPLLFESSLSCAVVPDHLFNGLIKNVLSLAFSSLPTDHSRAAVERRVASAARENGLPVTGYILNWGNDGSYKGLHNNTMTTMMCVLLCAATAFDAEYVKLNSRVFKLPRLLQDFVSAVYFWPCARTDGEHHAAMYTTEGRLEYYGTLRKMAEGYLQECDKVFEEMESESRSGSGSGAVLDKPNAHRAVELALHTIPTFGHARNCSELVLEMTHQVFKGWLEKNTHQCSHITAVERALARDWAGRVFALFKIWEGGTSRERACSEVGLRRLLLGEEAVYLDERAAGVTDLKAEFHSAMREAFREPTMSIMGANGHISLPRAQRIGWQVYDNDMVKNVDAAEMGTTFRRGRAKLAALYRLRSGYESRDLPVFTAARLVHWDLYEGKHRVYQHHEVVAGSVVSCVTECDGDVLKDDGGGFKKRFVAVSHIFKGPDLKIWAIGRDMRPEGVAGGGGYRSDCESVVAVELCGGVRRAGAMHVCNENCVDGARGLRIMHSAGPCEGGLYRLWTREDGYPPHMG